MSYCRDSPTKAHHWMMKGHGVTFPAVCKYCGERRTFNHPILYDMARLPKAKNVIVWSSLKDN